VFTCAEAASRLVGETVTAVWLNIAATPEIAARFNITSASTPTILIFTGGAKSDKSAYKYDGPKKGPDIAKAVMREVDRSGKSKEVVQLTSMDVIEKFCAGYNHVCVIGVMQPLEETGAKGRRRDLAVLDRMQTLFRPTSFSFLWFEAGTQPSLEKAMHLDFGFPALATFTLDATAYGTMRGSFSDKAVTAYLKGVASGYTPVQPLTKMFKVATIEPWNGQDAPDDTFENEIPLSEIMDDWEQDEGGKAESEEEKVEDDGDDDDFFRDEL
jgi:hypothetical protein